uniref:SCP domain-containing protein n=1 Tax=Mesocestoides corti TaxID=53468 RepID=A0A5K3FAQ6_MESCO
MRYIICLLVLTWNAVAITPNASERHEIMEMLKSVRETVEPPAKNMMLLNYSFELENLTEAWLNNCSDFFPNETEHPQYKGKSYIVLSSTSNETLSFADLKNFSAEMEKYNATTNTCPFTECSNYKQMVWANSTKVGCAKHRCVFTSYSVEHVACIFEPSGKVEYGRPYEIGKNCPGCPAGYLCHRNQCYLPAAENATTTSISTRLPVFRMVNAAVFLMFFIV